MEKPLEIAWVGLKVCVAGSQGITRVEQAVWARLMETLIGHLPASSMEGGPRKGTMASASTSFWKKAVPPALILMRCTSVSPHKSMVQFELLPQLKNSKLVWVKSVHWPFERNSWDFSGPLSHSAVVKPIDFSLWYWKSGLGDIVWV